MFLVSFEVLSLNQRVIPNLSRMNSVARLGNLLHFGEPE